MLQRGWFWLDVEYNKFTSGVAAEVRQYGVVHTGSIIEATRAVVAAREPWAGVITHLSGRERHLAYLREVAPSLPVLVLLEEPSESAIAALVARRFDHALLEQAGTVVPPFVQRALTSSLVPNAALATVVQELATRARLNPREVQILVYCIANEPRPTIQRRLGVSDNTFRKSVKDLIHKCGAKNLESLAVSTLREAVLKNGRDAKAPPSLTLLS